LVVKAGLLAIFISFSLSSYAQSHDQKNSYFNHLSEVNKEWSHHKEACPKGTISFSSDVDRIQFHLNLAIEYLKSNRPANLNSGQLASRLHLLGGLQEYVDKKVFPVNKYHTTRQPYFVDDFGTNCAVGQMIYLSGHKQLVAKISEEQNYDYIEDIKTEGVKEWANEFGFTMEELKWIQPTYEPTANMEQVLGGTNGSVNKIEYNESDESLTIVGEFTELDRLPCLNIGFYKNNQLDCLGNGIDGTIHDVVHQSGDIYVFGELNYNGEVFPGAKYDGSTWNYLNIPSREGAVCTSANGGGLRHQFEMAISHNSIPGHQEIWHFLDDNTWEKKAKVKGVVLDIIGSSYGFVHVGHLDSVVVYAPNGVVDTALTVNNILFSSDNGGLWYGIGGDVSDTVNVVASVGPELVFGGTCSNQSGLSNICISRYLNSTLQPIFLNYSEDENFSIKAITYDSGNKFIFGGDFHYRPFIGTQGSNLATCTLSQNYIEAIAAFDKAVNSLSYLGGELFIGGSFQTNLGIQSTNFLARQGFPVRTDDFLPDDTFDVYPNPFATSIHLEGIGNGVAYSILNIDGRMLKTGI